MNQRCTEGLDGPKRNALRAVSVCYEMHNRAASYGSIFRKNGKNNRKTGASMFFLLAELQESSAFDSFVASRFETFSLLPFLGQGRVSSRKCKVLHKFPNWHSPCNENRVGAYSSGWAPIRNRLSKREGRSLAGSYRNQRSSD
jgi:hypothetical protein